MSIYGKGIVGGSVNVNQTYRDGEYIKTVNGKTPDEYGNVEVVECTVHTVNNIEPDDTGNVQLPEVTPDDVLDILCDAGVIEPLADTTDSVYTDKDGVVYTL